MAKKERKVSLKKIKKAIIQALIVFFAVILFVILFTLAIYRIEVSTNKDSDKKIQPLLNAFIIVSPSMEPKINVKDAVIVRRVKPEKLKKNDIITFVSDSNKYEGLTITHRILKIEKEADGLYFKTGGDNNKAADTGYISEDDICGKVILVIPKLGYVQTFLGNAYGWVLLVLFPCVIVIIFDIVKILEIIKSGISNSITDTIDKRKEKKNYDKLVKEVDPVCYIESGNKKKHYYDLVSAVKAANKSNKDVTIVMETTEYHLNEKIVINNSHQKKITFTTASDILNCNIYKKTISDFIIKTELVLDGVVIQNKKK